MNMNLLRVIRAAIDKVKKVIQKDRNEKSMVLSVWKMGTAISIVRYQIFSGSGVARSSANHKNLHDVNTSLFYAGYCKTCTLRLFIFFAFQFAY